MATKTNPTTASGPPAKLQKAESREPRTGSLVNLASPQKSTAATVDDAKIQPKEDLTMNILFQNSTHHSNLNESLTCLHIKVLGAKHIKGTKGEHVNSLIRVQFADFDFKDSPIVNDTPTPEFNFSYEQTYHVDETLIDLFANGKITVTLFEALPKDKTMALGVTEIPLFQRFLQPKDKEVKLSFKETLPIVYSNQKLLQPASDAIPEIEIEVSISHPLLTESDLQGGSFASIRVEDVFPAPDELTLKEGNEKDLNSNIYTYNLEFYIPGDGNASRKIMVNNGLLIPSETPHLMESPKTIIEPESAQTSTSRSSDAAPNLDTKKINWAYTHHVFLSATAFRKLKEKAQKKETLDLEISRSMHPKFASVVDGSSQKYKGLARVDISALLFPGVFGIHGRYHLDALDAVPHEGTSRDAPTTAGSERSKGASKAEQSPYKVAGSTVYFKFLLEKPLIEKSSIAVIEKSVQDFIPRRVLPAHLVQEKRSAKADEEYHIEVQAIVAKLIDEYRAAISAGGAQSEFNSMTGLNSSSPLEEQQKKKQFLFHLNRNGAYFTFKEKLKSAVVQVVRERFNRKSSFTSKDEQQLFLSEVYVYLVDQMHVAMNKMLLDKDSAFADPTLSKTADFEALKEFADAAEYDFQTKIASEYHQERLAKYEDKMQSWYDYACFCLRNGDVAKGEECLREVLSRNPKHIPTLLAHGALCCIHEKFEESKVCLNAVLDADPKNVIALTLLGLYYDTIGNDHESDKYIQEASVINEGSSDSIYLKTAKFLVNMHASQLAEIALSRELLSLGRQVEPHLLLAELEIQKRDFAMAAYHIKGALDIKKDDPNVWSMQGHLYFIQQVWASAKDSYETVLSLTEDKKTLLVVYNRLGAIYLRQALDSTKDVDPKIAKLAKSVFLQACEIKPSSTSWLGAGRAAYALGEIQEAEDAYSEANVLNNRDSEVWAHLAILNLNCGRHYEANQSLAQALRLGIKEKYVLKTLGKSFLKESFTVQAVECLRLYLELDPDASDVRELLSKALQVEGKHHTKGPLVSGKLSGVREGLVK